MDVKFNRVFIRYKDTLTHCETYVFALELETALAKAQDEVFISLSSLIITGEGNEVFILSGTI